MISLCNPAESLATAFAVHRALDAGGALFGPVVAFVLLSQRPGSFDAIWLTSFAFALLGLAVLLLFVQNPSAQNTASTAASGLAHNAHARWFWILDVERYRCTAFYHDHQ